MGHPFMTPISWRNSPQPARMIGALGAEVVLVETDAQQITAKRAALRTEHFNHPRNAQARADSKCPEL